MKKKKHVSFSVDKRFPYCQEGGRYRVLCGLCRYDDHDLPQTLIAFRFYLITQIIILYFQGSAFMFGRAVTSVLWGLIADKYGRKPVILFGTVAVYTSHFHGLIFMIRELII